MKNTNENAIQPKRRGLSLDTWAVLLAFTLAALIRAGVFKHVPW